MELEYRFVKYVLELYEKQVDKEKVKKYVKALVDRDTVSIYYTALEIIRELADKNVADTILTDFIAEFEWKYGYIRKYNQRELVEAMIGNKE
jgi:DNA-binding transcriptional ArsR family regulator